MKDKGPVWDRYCRMKEKFPDALVVCGANVPKDGMVFLLLFVQEGGKALGRDISSCGRYVCWLRFRT